MRDVDRVAVEEVGLQLLQMMENAGRALAWHVRDIREGDTDRRILVVAGNGGNGGGGLVCARHLANRDLPVRVLLDRSPETLTGVAAHQHRIIDEMGIPFTSDVEQLSGLEEAMVVVDALIGYGISGDVRPPSNTYIERMNRRSDPIVSLDVPSGLDATTGKTLGVSVTPDRTVTLALPKTGLDGIPGTLFLADISVPGTVYERLGIAYTNPFEDRDWIRLKE
ncbi:NAD(P)H-hydrate epimerase [Salinirubellus sp. GCM10025818]|uniref:NAD(P)H-hydrate epimerase n=1 Tax=Salinirubellus TaxID=2162630 RepID=UPI0030CC3318